jgi:TatD DNase family protein
MIFDAHAHVNFNAFKDDAPEVIRRALDNEVWLINVGSQSSTSQRAVEIAEKYEKGVYACVGLHPIHLTSLVVDEKEIGVHFQSREEEFNSQFYSRLAQSQKVVGIGEVGLDYYYFDQQLETSLDNFKRKQKEIFKEQLSLADQLGLPVVLHCRGSKKEPEDAYWEMLEILKEKISAGKKSLRQSEEIGGVIHCFTSSWEIGQKFIDLGFYIGFTGIITFPTASLLQETVRRLPLECLLIETDCPYLSPQAVRGKRNEPLYVKYVAEKIAEIKKLPVKEVEQITFKNTLKVFKKIIVD